MAAFLVTWVGFGIPQGHEARADWYLAGYGGMVFPGVLTSATDSERFARFGATASARISDVQLENNLAMGMKAGFYFDKRPWLGLQTEVFEFFPNMVQQPTVVAQPGRVAFGAELPGAHLQATAWALNIMTRDSTKDRLNAYGGLGPALFSVYSSQYPGKLQLAPGMNLTGGMRYYFTDRVALFGEVKFHLVHFHFGGVNGDYTGQMFVTGLEYHFGEVLSRNGDE
jgi:hypothetical protein